MIYRIDCKPIIISWLLLVAYLIIFSIGLMNSIDVTVYQWVSSLTSQHMTSLMIAITFLGSWVSIVAICAICMIIHFRRGLIISLNVAMVWLINYVIKNIVARPRPSVTHLVIEESFSFPSAHAMVSFALMGFIAYLLWKKYKPLSLLLMLVVFLIGLTRIYLGVHYTSDVIGGFLFAFVYLCSVIPILKYHKILPST